MDAPFNSTEKILREMLQRAKSGEIIAVAIATLGPDLSTGSVYTQGDGTLAELLGSIELMKHRILHSSPPFSEPTLD